MLQASLDRALLGALRVGAFASGMLDLIFAFSLALERAALLDRSQIVEHPRDGQAPDRCARGRRSPLGKISNGRSAV